MPQMKPLLWLILLFFTILIFLMIFSMNYFQFLNSPPSYNSMNFINKYKNIWQW